MKLTTGCAFAVLSLVVSAAPSFAQGVTQSPPAPNGPGMPEPPNSVPPGARTLAPGSTGQERVGTIGRARVQPQDEAAAEGAPSDTGTSTQR